MKYRLRKESKPIPVLLDQALLDRITAVSERMGEAKSTVMRLAMRIGLGSLEKLFATATDLKILADLLKTDSSIALNDARKPKPKAPDTYTA